MTPDNHSKAQYVARKWLKKKSKNLFIKPIIKLTSIFLVHLEIQFTFDFLVSSVRRFIAERAPCRFKCLSVRLLSEFDVPHVCLCDPKTWFTALLILRQLRHPIELPVEFYFCRRKETWSYTKQEIDDIDTFLSRLLHGGQNVGGPNDWFLYFFRVSSATALLINWSIEYIEFYSNLVVAVEYTMD